MSTRLRSKIQHLLENLDLETSDLGGGDDGDVNTSMSVVGWSAQRRPQDETGGSGSDDDHSDLAADSGDAARHTPRSRQGRARIQNSAAFTSPLEQLLSLERRVLQLMQEKQVSLVSTEVSVPSNEASQCLKHSYIYTVQQDASDTACVP